MTSPHEQAAREPEEKTQQTHVLAIAIMMLDRGKDKVAALIEAERLIGVFALSSYAAGFAEAREATRKQDAEMFGCLVKAKAIINDFAEISVMMRDRGGAYKKKTEDFFASCERALRPPAVKVGE